MLAAVAWAVLTPSVAHAGYITLTLDQAGPGNFAIFALGGTNLLMTDATFTGPGTTIGSVAVANGGQFANSSSTPPGVDGNLYLSTGVTTNISGGVQVSGTTYTGSETPSEFGGQTVDEYLGAGSAATPPGFWAGGAVTATGAVLDALNAAMTFANLAPNDTVAGDITGSQTLTAGVPGPNNTWVVNVDGDIDLGNGEFLTLSGPLGTQFILNVSGTIKIGGGDGEGIVLAGGLTVFDVVINVKSTGNGSAGNTTGDNVTTNGGGNAAVINGILLDVAGGVNMSPGLVNGEIIGGGSQIRLVSGAEVHNSYSGDQDIQGQTPEPASLLLLGSGLGFIAQAVRRRRRR